MSRSKTIHCPAGVNLLDYLSRNGIDLPAFCDGNGACGRCRVKVTEGTLPVTPSDAAFLSPELLCQGWRLACRAVTTEPVTVEVSHPDDSEISHVQKSSPHQYGAAISKRSIALLDLTFPTIVDMSAYVGDPREALSCLIAKYPDARNHLKWIVTTGTFDIEYPGVNVVASRTEDVVGNEGAFEAAIMEAFRIGTRSDENFGI